MNANVVTEISLPLVPTLGLILSFAGCLVGIVVWVFTTFERKVEALARHAALEERVKAQEKLLGSVARDVSYIRGRMEPKE